MFYIFFQRRNSVCPYFPFGEDAHLKSDVAEYQGLSLGKIAVQESVHELQTLTVSNIPCYVFFSSSLF